MQFVKERLGKWITAAIVLVVGILCIVAGAAMHGQDGEAAANALKAISLVLGIVLIIVGALTLVMSIVVAVLAKKGFAAVAIPGAVLVAFGISLVAQPYAAELIALFLLILPYLLLCVGAVILGDAIFNLVMGIKAKNVNGVLVGVIVEFVVAAAIIIGALCVGADSVIPGATQLIIFGIIVCLAAVLLVVLTFVKMPDVVVAVVTKKEEKPEEPKEEK